ncbi:uncharacterized protein RJT20DRAFT_128421 [Scheffersomyces xylosifermentans]|uniref:uncharacterized protein n=1 Tax=Scheffersomyces xylosifermentans TaxID=1304137 RepID=UPI00315C5306
MSTAVYYSSNHTMPVDDVHSKHTLPSLAQIIPPHTSHQVNQQNQQLLPQSAVSYTHDATLAAAAAVAAASTSPTNSQVSPSLSANSLVPMNSSIVPIFGDSKVMYQNTNNNSNNNQNYNHQTPEVYSQNSQPSTANSTPASSFSGGSTSSYSTVTGMNMGNNHSGSISSASSMSSNVTEKCICKSNANRIPRPRNAFILFRQKYHQSVLDEGNVIRTNPEVSRELGRRWRALSADEKDHWNNLAEEEKKNHAKKYPGYRYTPRRNGKNKNCNICRQNSLRQQQAQIQHQQMMQIQQDQYQQYLQMQQVQQVQLQQQQNQQQLQQNIQQPIMAQQQQLQQQLQQQQLQQVQLQQQGNLIPQHGANYSNTGNNQQFIISANPYIAAPPLQGVPTAPGYQLTYNNNSENANSSSSNVGSAAQDKLSPLSTGPSQQYSVHPQHSNNQAPPAGSGSAPSHSNNSSNASNEYLGGGNAQYGMSYDQLQQQNAGHYQQQQQQRYGSLPTPVNNGSNNYGFDSFGMPQQPTQ